MFINPEFFLLLILPWGLDLFGQTQVLATIFGVVLWSFAVALCLGAHQAKDLKLQKILKYSARFFILIWFLYWIYGNYFNPSAQKLFNWNSFLAVGHVIFLVLGLGMILLNLGSALLGLLKEWSLKNKNLKLIQKVPSLESLRRTCARSWQYALSLWGLGLFLSIVSLWLKNSHSESPVNFDLFSVLSHPKLLISIVMWLFLLILYPIEKRLRTLSSQFYMGAFLFFSSLFVTVFSFLIKNSAHLDHQSLRLFLR